MKRKYIQLISAVLYNCHITGFFTGKIYKGKTKGICVPGLNCYSCPGAVAACPLGSLQNALTVSAYRVCLYILGTLLLFGILFGRLICGFLCPFGLIQELLYLIPLPKIQKSKATAALSCLKYAVLLFTVIAIPLVRFIPAFCKYICPAGTLEAGLPLVIADEVLRSRIGWLFSWKVFVLVVFVLISMICFRAFCRFICPLGALYSLLNPVSFFGITVDRERCTGCNACIDVCKMDTCAVGDRECIQCGECIHACPECAIRYKTTRGKDKWEKEN